MSDTVLGNHEIIRDWVTAFQKDVTQYLSQKDFGGACNTDVLCKGAELYFAKDRLWKQVDTG